MPRAIPDFQPALDLSANLEREIEFLAPRSPKLIHYTSLDGFYGIFETGRVRLTSVKSTNDPSEFLFGREVVEQTLVERIKGAVGYRKDALEKTFAGFDQRDFRAFVFCMSEVQEDEDLVGELSQWRLYGADGRGVALVFDLEHFDKRRQLERMISIPRRVVYGETEGMKLVNQEIDQFFDGFEAFPDDYQNEMVAMQLALSGYIGNCLFWLPSVIKHRAYRHEREVRLVRGDIGLKAGNPLVFYEKGTIRRPAIEMAIAEQAGDPPNDNFYRRL